MIKCENGNFYIKGDVVMKQILDLYNKYKGINDD